MQTYTDTGRSETGRSGGIRGFFRRIEAWLDHQGKGAWIAAMVVGFILFWPLGLALLAYMIWGKQMFARNCSSRSHRRGRDHAWGHGSFATGNSAFDSYKTEALRRLEDEQAAFEAFLQRLRSSKDKAEFDTFMEDRSRTTAAQDAAATEAAETAEADDRPAGKPAVKPTKDSRPGEY